MKEIEQAIHWCKNCKTPIITKEKKVGCPLCGTATKRMCADMRPVFPEERLLIEVLLKKPLAFIEQTMWASPTGRYYVDGESLLVPQELYHYQNAQWVREDLEKYRGQNNGTVFEKSIERFILANKKHLAEIQSEAIDFIQMSKEKFPDSNIAVGFSGGKDSTVVADLAIEALGIHGATFMFTDTTLETRETYEYVERFQQEHPQAKFLIARNDEQDFFEVCKDIGPPSRNGRWCCTMFKTGPMAQKMAQAFGKKAVLNFLGIRASESDKRKHYIRLNDSVTANKIQQQIPAYPIFHWQEVDVWLYILSKQLDFCKGYRSGHSRVGCWLCPNSAKKTVFLHQVQIPEKAYAWREQLIAFANQIGKEGAENYIDSLAWSMRYGSSGLPSSEDTIVETLGCTTEENANIYKLKKPFRPSFHSLFTPFGDVVFGQGRSLLNETLVLDKTTGNPILSIQLFSNKNFAHSVKVKILAESGEKALQRKIVYQVRKFNACRNCRLCNSTCVFDAIQIKDGEYSIDPQKCTRCKKCVNPKFIETGCYMHRILKPRKAAS